MKPNNYTLLSIAIMFALHSQYAQADLKTQCLLNVPHFTGEKVTGDQRNLPVYIESDSATLNQHKNAIYSGDVIIKQGNRTINTQQITVSQNQKGRFVKLDEQFDYQDGGINASGKTASLDLATKNANLSDVDYHLMERQGRGSAKKVKLRNNTRILKNATYTACLPNDNSWQIDASEMTQYIDKEYAEMWHARLKVLGVPVFYTPYLQIPLGDRRRSGLLTASYSHSSRTGLMLKMPFYWNIAPNMDMTITPTYYSHRGWQISPEFRYLTKLGQGTIAAEYMKKDRYHNWDNEDHSRHLFYWKHNVSFLSDWRLSMDYTRVSDKQYFSHFNSAYGSSTDGHVAQNIKLSYYQPNYNLSIAGKKFQVFDEDGAKPYRALPQVEFNYYQDNIWKNADFSLYSQLTYFDNDSDEMPTAWRLHLEPTLNLPLSNKYASINLETKLYATQYWQKSGKKQADTMKSHITRVLPQFKVNFKTILEADKQLFKGFDQTLEPQIQYLYRPYRNQHKIGTTRYHSLGLGYDSMLRQQDYFSLFSDRRYSGLDRIASANQITLGATTRFMKEKTGQEYFNLSLGQIYYLSNSRIDNESPNSDTHRSTSWALETNWRFDKNWNLNGSYQYDTRLKETSLANLSLQYKPDHDKVVQLNYRYASQNYIDQNLSKGRGTYNQDIKQAGIVLGWNVTNNVSVMMSHYQDLALDKYVESQLGLTYNTCCWKVSGYISRHLIPKPNNTVRNDDDMYYDNSIGVNFELRFGSDYSSDVSKMLKKGIIPYTEEFDIN
ncbi:LPS assembly protein LptD [Phocoenobacter atlanticus]|uniref:LPS assembly protein LptD n=1 Tax=Phocoenobacter atlanticus TaxID=3416742 RepID=UPI0027447334|nr:LPS assembly protein LptD [Pasteurella atlantica]MDP8100678.1 LPS assembly protein LptD [Pasteurella atlantica]